MKNSHEAQSKKSRVEKQVCGVFFFGGFFGFFLIGKWEFLMGKWEFLMGKWVFLIGNVCFLL
jgi:hypothetical protein